METLNKEKKVTLSFLGKISRSGKGQDYEQDVIVIPKKFKDKVTKFTEADPGTVKITIELEGVVI